MTESTTEKDVLVRYLEKARRDLISKLDGLDERQIRWPMTPTGSNLLGIVKHVGSVEVGYFTEVFGREGIDFPWFADDAAVNADMWAAVEESREDVLAMYARCVVLIDASLAELDLDAVGHVPWWGDRGDVTLRSILTHVGHEVARHAGHADIIRELIDGAAGNDDGNLPVLLTDEWSTYCAMLQDVAFEAEQRYGSTDAESEVG